ncbi:MAG: DUF1905 domain-containing protein [Bacteroidia bacterium]
MVRFNTHIFRKTGNVWDVAIFIPKERITSLYFEKDRRIICTINEFHFHAALMPNGDGNYFVNTNKEVRKSTGINLGDEVEVTIKVDTSMYGMPLPEEFKTAWELDEEGKVLFDKLTMGKQRSLIHIVGKLKSSEKRIEKSLVILEYLKSVQGKLDFKELNQAFKYANKK